MKIPTSIYCEIYGNTKDNIVLDYFLGAYSSDLAPSEIYMLENISKPKVYQVIEEFMKKGIVVKSRVIGRTQMYKLNKDNRIVKIYIRNFKECLEMVFDKYMPKKNTSGRTSMTVSAKGN